MQRGKIFLLQGHEVSVAAANCASSGTGIAELPSHMAEGGFLGQTVILTLVALVAAAGCIHLFAPRFRQRFRAAGSLQTLGLLTLTPQCSVALVRVGRETLVLGVTSQRVTLLTKTPECVVGEDGEGKRTAELGVAP